MTLEEYKKSKNFYYFYEISKIPRPSFHEERVADYVERFAKDHGYWYTRDALHNIIIKKPGSAGREQEPPLILQAHMDMVCTKAPGSTHDFMKDPIDIRLVDGWLMGNETTLGADDGAGVANILGLLDEPDLSHPPLECIFTVQEEDGMGGAKGIDLSCLQGKRMIGLDGEEEGTTLYTASAVWACMYRMKIKREPSCGTMFSLKIGGLSSGHGAGMIGSQRANAVKLASRILRRLEHIRIASAQGGGLIHVIPRDCTVVFESAQTLEEIQTVLEPVMDQIRAEFAVTDPAMTMELAEVIEAHETVLSADDTKRILRFLYLLPIGARNRNPEEIEQTIGSFNLSILRVEEEHVECSLVCRANYPIDVDELRQTAYEYADLFDASCETLMEYAGHYVPKDSPMIQLWDKVYREKMGKPIKVKYIHAGLDAGTIFQKLKLDDLIIIMPTTQNVHTIHERMNADSFYRTYEYLKEILAQA